MAYRILAHHAHVFPAELKPEASLARLTQLLDATGIEQAVCFAPFSHQVDSTFDYNGWLAGAIKSSNRFHGFGTVDFTRDDMADQVKKISDLGLLGIKLHPNSQKFDLLGERSIQLYENAQARKLFLTFHTGVHHYRLTHYDVKKFDEIGYNFPDLKFSMEHVGGYHFFNEALAVIFNNIPFPPVPGRRCNVFAGLTSVFTQDYNRFWYLSPERIKELIAQVGVEQVIFGLDFPYNIEDRTHVGLNAIRGLGLHEEETALILGGNLRRELGIA
jgi:predicted TIM-barrel fold metal-dependent hydrolase